MLGMRWKGGLFIDTALPFGLRSAPKIFTAVADAVQWIVEQEGVKFVIHYLGDYLVVGSPGTAECATAMRKLVEVLEQLGFPIAAEKKEGPTVALEFLGLEVNTADMVVRLPERKVVELKGLLQQWLDKKAIPRRELESLVGKLAHAAQVVQPGKTFMRRLFELQKGCRKLYHMVRLSQSIRSDLQWWALFMEDWNGIRIIKAGGGSVSQIHVWTNASGNYGCGAVVQQTGDWLQHRCPEVYQEGQLVLREESITLKELLPVVLACAVWGDL